MSSAASAVWFVIRGESPFTEAIEPGPHFIPVPDEVLAWAEGHGLGDDEPDVYILVAPAEEAEPEVQGEVARRRHPLDDETAALLREAWTEAH